MSVKSFEKYVDTPVIERSICPRGHKGPDGRNVRKENQYCLACVCFMPDGAFTQIFTNIMPKKKSKCDLLTSEECRKLHIESVKEWNKRNKDKTRVYTKKYFNKPEIKAKTSEKNKIKYAALSEENKEKLRERSRAYYYRKKAEKAQQLEAERAQPSSRDQGMAATEIPTTTG